MDGDREDARPRKFHDEERLAVEIPETAHQISSGLFPFFFTHSCLLCMGWTDISVFQFFLCALLPDMQSLTMKRVLKWCS